MGIHVVLSVHLCSVSGKEEKLFHFYKITVQNSKTHIFHIAVQSRSMRTEMDRRIMKGNKCYLRHLLRRLNYTF